MGRMNHDEAVKTLLKANSKVEVNMFLDTTTLDDCKEIIKLLLARYNNLTIQSILENSCNGG